MKHTLLMRMIIHEAHSTHVPLTSADRTARSLLRDTLLLGTRELGTVTRHVCLGAVHKPVMTGAHVTRGHSVHLTMGQGGGQLWHWRAGF